MLPEETCSETTTVPTGETVTCNKHRKGWHLQEFFATWPEQLEPGDLFCMVWGWKDTSSGMVWVRCGKVPHGGNLHYGHLGGMPVSFTVPAEWEPPGSSTGSAESE